MSEQNINKEAFKQAEEQLLNERVSEVKGYILQTLKEIESKKQQKDKIEEELRVLKLNLDDLRNGKFDKIEERISKSPVARSATVRIYHGFAQPFTTWPKLDFPDPIQWPNITSGTYPTGSRIYYL